MAEARPGETAQHAKSIDEIAAGEDRAEAAEAIAETIAPKGRLRRWVLDSMPRREDFENNRWLRPFARRVMNPALWRLTRRSVPRGVALGMVTGILIPMGQIPASAVLALPLRANIPAAAATTLLTNPVTTPPLWIAAYWIGHWMLGIGPAHGGASAASADRSWTQWLLHDAGPATLTGLVTITILCAIVGYVAAALGWRWWIARKWRRRSRLRNDDTKLHARN